MRIKKSKFFKAFGFSSLALLVGFGATMAFAPLGASPQLANASEMVESTTTSGLGLDPKNDPVVYTTESGLEIRMSNATQYTGTTTTTTNRGNNYTQNLSSFYYFTMGAFTGKVYTANGSVSASYDVNSEPVNWIILGLGPNTSYFLDEVASTLFSTWKTNTTGLSQENSNAIGGPYFFENVFESTTPAGSAINGVVPSKSYVMEKVKASIPVNPGNRNEIPSGCMLVISEKILGLMSFNSDSTTPKTYSNSSNTESNYLLAGSNLGTRYRYIGTSTSAWTISGNAGGSLYNYINSLFSKNTSGTILKNGLGFTQTQANLIVPQQLYTYYYGTAHAQETPSTDGGTYYTMFPLAGRYAHSSTTQNFCVEDYLPNANQRVASLIKSNQTYFWWLRSGISENQTQSAIVYCSGNFGNGSYGGSSDYHGVRPAMVMRLQ